MVACGTEIAKCLAFFVSGVSSFLPFFRFYRSKLSWTETTRIQGLFCLSKERLVPQNRCALSASQSLLSAVNSAFSVTLKFCISLFAGRKFGHLNYTSPKIIPPIRRRTFETASACLFNKRKKEEGF